MTTKTVMKFELDLSGNEPIVRITKGSGPTVAYTLDDEEPTHPNPNLN